MFWCLALVALIQEKPAQALIEVSAPSLWLTYEKPKDGDEKYKGKWIVVKGSLEAVKPDADKQYVAGLVVVSSPALTPAQLKKLPPKEQRWYKDGYPPNVLCKIEPGKEKTFASIRGQANIIGQVVGRKDDADVPGGYVVIMERCILSEHQPPAKPKKP